MFALGIRYLMGRAVATEWGDREKAEWPPHPDRVFMALLAAHAETEDAPAEAEALRWLERLPPPFLAASESAGWRQVVTSYVPVNDDSSPMLKNKPVAPMGTMPIGRVRQPRHFPAVIPDDPDVYLIWPDHAPPGNNRHVLDMLCSKVTYLGHSSTPVMMWVEDKPPDATLRPNEHAQQRLRVFGPGRYDELRARHKAQVRPQPALWQGYGRATVQPPQHDWRSSFDDSFLVLRQVDGRRFSLESTVQLVQALRNTLMTRVSGKPVPWWLSGHDAEGRVVKEDHVAMFPLAFVGREHADGHLLGLALAVPRVLPAAVVAELRDLLQAEARYYFVRLVLGHHGSCSLELDTRGATERPFTLNTTTYTHASHCWETVTPVVLDRNPRRQLTAERIVVESCVRGGLPQPSEVAVNHSSFLAGVPNARSFPALPYRASRNSRPLMHVRLVFDRRVRGPVMLGAGRFVGYGLFRPNLDRKEGEA